MELSSAMFREHESVVNEIMELLKNKELSIRKAREVALVLRVQIEKNSDQQKFTF